MRPAAPEHKIVYVRFHKRVDALLEEFSRKTGMKRASAVMWIQRRYFDILREQGKTPETLTREDFNLTGIEETYFISLGRAGDGSALGRGMQLTVDKSEERLFSLIAMRCELSTRDLRTAILVQYFHSLDMI